MGLDYSYFRLVTEDIDEVHYFGGATYVIDSNSKKSDGVTLGSYININYNGVPIDEKGNFAPYNLELYAHEYGHYIQSQETGWGYLISHGYRSLKNAISEHGKRKKVWNPTKKKYVDVPLHHFYWTETDANRKAEEYFRKILKSDFWRFSVSYPTK